MAKNVFLEGDWLKADKVFNGLALRLIGARNAAGHVLADQGARRVRANIFAQRYGHTELAPFTVKRKEAKGLDPRILIATGDYVRGIHAMSLGSGRWGIGVSDPELVAKGMQAEYGGVTPSGSQVPPRPHLSVELERLRMGSRTTIAMAMSRALAGKTYGAGLAADLAFGDEGSEEWME